MITPEEFPYITSIHINDCYAYQDFDIVLHDYKPGSPFSHLILTGKNGSGKSTILRSLDKQMAYMLETAKSPQAENKLFFTDLNRGAYAHWPVRSINEEQSRLEELNRVEPAYRFEEDGNFWNSNKLTLLYAYFQTVRESRVSIVEAPSREAEFIEKLNTTDSAEYFTRQFKQYLVNLKIEQAFSQIEQQTAKIEQVNTFFNKLEEVFKAIFEDNSLQLVFSRKNYEFYMRLSGQREVTFNMLPDGTSALLSIVMDLFTRIYLIRGQVKDFTYDPCGIVLIDEPETHLHLQLQEQVLPMLIRQFPNIQFIVATHSPAVVASIKKVTVFDVATKDTRTDEVVGRSYSELMTSHFGLENDYSSEADKIIKQINEAVEQFNDDPEQLRDSLQQLSVENAHYLSPSLKIELELLLAQSEARFAAHQ